MAQAKAAKKKTSKKAAAQKKPTTVKKQTTSKKASAQKKPTTAKKSVSKTKTKTKTSKPSTAKPATAKTPAKASTSKKTLTKKAAPKKKAVAASKSTPTPSGKGSKPASTSDGAKQSSARPAAEQAVGRQPDLVLRADDPNGRSRSDWRTRSGKQPPLAADDRRRSRSSTLKMTASKLVPFEDDTVEVGIRFPNPKGLLRRLFGGEEPIHEHRVSWILTGGGDTTRFETALTDFLESFGYQLDSTEPAVEGRARCSIYYGRERNRQAACRNAHQALRGALAQTTGRVLPAAARAAEDLVAALAQYANGLVELEGLMLVRISEGGRAHVAVKLVAEV